MTLREAALSLRASSSKEDCLERSYNLLTQKYHGERVKTLTRFWELFYRLDKIWKKEGFLHCPNLNRLLAYLLLESGWFKPEDIEKKWTLLWSLSPHQYLLVRIEGNKWVSVDIWAKNFGIPFGEHAQGWIALIV